MPIKTGQGIAGTVPTLAELADMAQVIDDMVTFSSDGEMFINQLPAPNSIVTYTLAVHKLTSTILS